ncbi:hypothetical protein AOQ84DRAFT_359310 [Glonium stellatum]|uniref:Extracellular membrane protein CFEM domain-containing protein n=1 Tax=Glonium stellatum TaxID=574774 RepID=A0A8E2FB83_9PEZI|nr:hypothetical protein AOQ84DRAFT_359310 [Glonium stellatum]
MALDGSWQPFSTMSGYGQLNPCARSCDFDTNFNGCDISKCWCNSGNLNLRMSSMGVCFSSSCTYSFMNTATDLTTMSYIQIEYCSMKGFTNLPGLSVPSKTTQVVTSNAAATSGAAAASSAAVFTTAIVTGGQTLLTAITAPSSPTASSQNSPSTGGLSTGAMAGIGVGAAFVILLALLFIVLVRLLRRKQRKPPPAMQPYQGPYAPQPQPQPPPPQARGQPAFQPRAPQMAAAASVVSPIEEKQHFQRKPVSRSASQATSVSPVVSAAGIQMQHQQEPPPVPVGQEMDASETARRNELDVSELPRSELPAYQRNVAGPYELGPDWSLRRGKYKGLGL